MGLEALALRALYKAKELILIARLNNIGSANRVIRATQGGLQRDNRTFKNASICVKAEAFAIVESLEFRALIPVCAKKKSVKKLYPLAP